MFPNANPHVPKSLSAEPSEDAVRDSAFDSYATAYDDALSQGIAVSGESKEFFAVGRVKWLKQCLHTLHEQPKTIMDFGCGTGTAVPYLSEFFSPTLVAGVDVSEKSLEFARKLCPVERVQFHTLEAYVPHEGLDLVFCNGVFHHIPLAERVDAVNYIFRSLRPGGLFAFWENNPWNPGTRYVMSRIPFDHDAITLTPPEARHLLQKAGFEWLRTDFQFVFPRALSPLRRVEQFLSRLPLGAQYQILCRKPGNRHQSK